MESTKFNGFEKFVRTLDREMTKFQYKMENAGEKISSGKSNRIINQMLQTPIKYAELVGSRTLNFEERTMGSFHPIVPNQVE